MNRIEGTFSVYFEEVVDLGADIALCFLEFGMIGRRPLAQLTGEIIRQCVGQDEITIGQSLHECAGAEPVRAVIGEIRFPDHIEAGKIAHQIVIDPQTAHRIMDGGINAHRHFICVLARDFLVNLEQVTVALADRLLAKPLNCVRQIEINAASAGPNTASFVANFLGRTRRDVARGEIAVARIFSLEIIIALRFWNFVRRFVAIFFAFRDPDPSVVAQRFRHERQLGLMFTADRNAGGMNLSETRVREERALFISAIGGGDIAAARIG